MNLDKYLHAGQLIEYVDDYDDDVEVDVVERYASLENATVAAAAAMHDNSLKIADNEYYAVDDLAQAVVD